jgi:hypothetical protein
LLRKKNSPNFRASFVIFKKVPKENNRPIGAKIRPIWSPWNFSFFAMMDGRLLERKQKKTADFSFGHRNRNIEMDGGECLNKK